MVFLYSGDPVSCPVLSTEDIESLRKDIVEQERLISGYQRENERLLESLHATQRREKEQSKRSAREQIRLSRELHFMKRDCNLDRPCDTISSSSGGERGGELSDHLYVIGSPDQEASSSSVLEGLRQKLVSVQRELESERSRYEDEVERLKSESATARRKSSELETRCLKAENSLAELRMQLSSTQSTSITPNSSPLLSSTSIVALKSERDNFRNQLQGLIAFLSLNVDIHGRDFEEGGGGIWDMHSYSIQSPYSNKDRGNTLLPWRNALKFSFWCHDAIISYDCLVSNPELLQ